MKIRKPPRGGFCVFCYNITMKFISSFESKSRVPPKKKPGHHPRGSRAIDNELSPPTPERVVEQEEDPQDKQERILGEFRSNPKVKERLYYGSLIRECIEAGITDPNEIGAVVEEVRENLNCKSEYSNLRLRQKIRVQKTADAIAARIITDLGGKKSKEIRSVAYLPSVDDTTGDLILDDLDEASPDEIKELGPDEAAYLNEKIKAHNQWAERQRERFCR